MSLDWERVRTIFFAAIERSPEERNAYLEESTGDDEQLRREVESLLEHHHEEELVQETSASRVFETLLEADFDLPVPAPDERYRELDELGVGGCGRVTSTWDQMLQRRVARKELILDRPDQRAMLLHEARLLAWLDHPGSVAVYDIDVGDGETAYTMRLLDGETLRARMDAQGRLAVQESIRVLSRISETMANAHAKGVLHLDLKPANLMLLPYGQVCILDWGVARFFDLEAYQAYLTLSGQVAAPQTSGYQGVAGTPSYMPAEQAEGDPLTPATDIYAAGCILYEMLVGRLPRSGKDSATEPTLLRAHRADVPERLEALCLRMLAQAPSERPASFGEVLAELDQLYGVDLAEERQLQAGEVLFREGESGQEAFHILEGTVAVTVEGPSGPTELARRTVGDLVGEMAVVLNAPRSATVTAVEPTRVATVTKEFISRAMASANPLLARMLKSLSARLREEAERVNR